MTIRYNKFAWRYTACFECGRVFWLERYKQERHYNLILGRDTLRVICKKCVTNADTNE